MSMNHAVKKILILILWSVPPGFLWAQPDLNPSQRWVEQIDGSFALPSLSSTAETNPGLGGDINIGYRLDQNWALFAGSGYYQYNLSPPTSGSSALLAYIPLVGILRLTFGEGFLHPYVFAGTGIALNTYSQNNAPGSPGSKINQAEIDFYLAPGLGILCRVYDGMALFLQARLDLDFTSPHGLGIPLASPSVFIPLQAGISFFAL